MKGKSQNLGNASKNSSRPKGRIPSLSSQQISAIKKIIDNKLHVQEEIKKAYYSADFSVGAYGNSGFAANQCIAISPYGPRLIISQGTGQADRIGNHVRTVRCRLKIVMYLAAYNATTNPSPQPQVVRFWIFKKKNNANELSSLTNFFQTGNSSSAPTGTLRDYNYDINDDLYHVFATKDVKLGYAAFVATPGGTAPQGYYSNNDSEMSAVFEWDVTKYIPKDVDWTDASSVPTTDVVMCTYESVNQDGTSSGTNTVPIVINLQVCYDYTDA